MRAIILAAGRGLRLQQDEDRQLPKCLLQFGGMSLLERHLRLLKAAGIDDVVLALGYRHEWVEVELDRLQWAPRPTIVLNPRFDLGSVLTVHAVADAMTRGGDVLLMDADVLYDARIAEALTEGRTHYSPIGGEPHFRAAIAEHTTRTIGVPVVREKVWLTRASPGARVRLLVTVKVAGAVPYITISRI